MTGTAKPQDVWTTTPISLFTFEGGLGQLTLEDLKVKNSPCAVNFVLLHTVQHNIKFGIVPFYDSAFAEPPHDSRTFVEGAEHDSRSAILVQMADSLDAGACSIHIGEVVAIEDTQSR